MSPRCAIAGALSGALFNSIKLAPIFSGYRLEPPSVCVIGHRGGEAFGAFDLRNKHFGVGHWLRSLTTRFAEAYASIVNEDGQN
jgi:hypothetical protein